MFFVIGHNCKNVPFCLVLLHRQRKITIFAKCLANWFRKTLDIMVVLCYYGLLGLVSESVVYI